MIRRGFPRFHRARFSDLINLSGLGFIFFLITFHVSIANERGIAADEVVYHYPPANAEWVAPSDIFLFRIIDLSQHSPKQVELLQWSIIDQDGREYPGKLDFLSGSATWRWIPDDALPLGSEMRSSVKYSEGGVIREESWKFTVRPIKEDLLDRIPGFDASESVDDDEIDRIVDSPRPVLSYRQDMTSVPITGEGFDLPYFISGTIYTKGEQSPGNVYIAPFPWGGEVPPFRMTINASNRVSTYRFQDEKVEAYLPYPEFGMIAIHKSHFLLYDSTMVLEDEVSAGIGITDFHDLRLLPDGHMLVLGAELRLENMSQYVVGGAEEATVVGTVVEEYDAAGELVFRWRALDAEEISYLDAQGYCDLTVEYVDFMHSNSMDIWSDGNIIISVRHFAQVLNIDRLTGAVNWRFGGQESDFSYSGGRPFLMQHDARLLDNGNLMVFDNNGYNQDPSRIVEFHLDEDHMTATLVWSFEHPEAIASINRGNSRRLPNGNTMIGWGGTSSNIMATEVTPEGEIVWEMELEDGPEGGHYVSYQVHKVSMSVSSEIPELYLERVGVDNATLVFAYFGEEELDGFIIQRSTSQVDFEFVKLVTTTNYTLTSLDFSGSENYFRVVPVYAEGGFGPASEVVYVSAQTLDVPKVSEGLKDWQLLTSWPNPFNASTTVSLRLDLSSRVELVLFNTLGQRVKTLHQGRLEAGVHHWTIDAEGLTSGVYFLRVRDGQGGVQTRKISLLR